MEIRKPTVMEAWTAGLRQILADGAEFLDHNNRVCVEVLHLTLAVTDPQRDFRRPIDTMNARFKWVFPDFEELENSILNRESHLNYEQTYGYRICRFGGGFNQLDNYVLPLLKADPNTRRAVMVTYNPLLDSNVSDKTPVSMMVLHFKACGRLLHASAFIRSNEVFIGWPANVFQLVTLQRYLGERLGLEPGEIVFHNGSAHIFKDNLADIRAIVGA